MVRIHQIEEKYCTTVGKDCEQYFFRKNSIYFRKKFHLIICENIYNYSII